MESMDFVKDLGTLGGKVVGSKGIKMKLLEFSFSLMVMASILFSDE